MDLPARPLRRNLFKLAPGLPLAAWIRPFEAPALEADTPTALTLRQSASTLRFLRE